MGFLQIYFYIISPQKLLQTNDITVGYVMIQHFIVRGFVPGKKKNIILTTK